MKQENIIEMFKLAFGEEEYQRLVEAATNELVAELTKKAAFNDDPKHPLYQNASGSITQGTPSNKEIISDTWDAIKGQVSGAGKEIKQNIAAAVGEKVTTQENKVADKARDFAAMIESKAPKKDTSSAAPRRLDNLSAGELRELDTKLQEARFTTDTPAGELRKMEAGIHPTQEQAFKNKMRELTTLPSKEKTTEKVYELANKGVEKALEAVNENPSAAAAIAGGAGATGLLGAGLLGRGLARAIRKNKVPREVVASISDEILEELIKES